MVPWAAHIDSQPGDKVCALKLRAAKVDLTGLRSMLGVYASHGCKTGKDVSKNVRGKRVSDLYLNPSNHDQLTGSGSLGQK